jgi:hypothetical protein
LTAVTTARRGDQEPALSDPIFQISGKGRMILKFRKASVPENAKRRPGFRDLYVCRGLEK